jgi:hypothetical protein
MSLCFCYNNGYTFLKFTYTSTVSVLTLILTLSLSLILHLTLTLLKLAQNVFFSAVCALCPRCPGAVWPQRSHAGGVFFRAFVQPAVFL